MFPFDVLVPAITLALVSRIILRPASKVGFALLVVAITADLWWTASGLIRPETEAVVAQSGRIDHLLLQAARREERSFAPYGGMEMSRLAVSDLRAADGYDSFLLKHYADLGRLASGCSYEGYTVSVPPTASSPEAVEECPHFEPNMEMLALLNVKYVLLPSQQSIEGADLVFHDREVRLYELPSIQGKAFGVSKGIVVEPQQCFDALAKIDTAEQAVSEELLSFGPAQEAPEVLSVEEQTNGEVIDVSARTDGLLVRSESWAPGWKVTVDGESAKVIRVDCALQGVWLEPGTHKVKFFYAPDGFLVGRWISLMAVALLISGSVWFCWQKMRSVRKKR
jgi:hypothetical protein